MDGIPNPEQLIERIRVLFGVVVAHRFPAGDDSPYISSDHIDEFAVPIVGVDAELVDAEKITAAWLTTPNPSFGGLCPQNLIDGTDDQRAFLASFLSSIEDGAFT